MKTNKIAVFDPQLRLVAIASGISQLAKLMRVGTGELLRASKGERICCKGYYIRYIPQHLMIDVDDIGVDELTEFDLGECNEDRLIYTTRNQKSTGIILESEFVKLRESKYRHYTYNKNKKKRVEGEKQTRKRKKKGGYFKESQDPW